MFLKISDESLITLDRILELEWLGMDGFECSSYLERKVDVIGGTLLYYIFLLLAISID